jgi:hypothetical protein
MRLIPIAAITFSAGLALAGAAAAQQPGSSVNPPAKAQPATPTLPDAAAKDKAEAAEHASDTAKDNASPNSAVDAKADVDASATAKDADDAKAKTDKMKKKHSTLEPGHGDSPEKPH